MKISIQQIILFISWKIFLLKSCEMLAETQQVQERWVQFSDIFFYSLIDNMYLRKSLLYEESWDELW